MTESSDLQRSIDQLNASINQLRTELVRQDVYASDQRGVSTRIGNVERDLGRLDTEVKEDRDKGAATRRLWLVSLAIPIAVFLIQLYIQAQLGGHS